MKRLITLLAFLLVVLAAPAPPVVAKVEPGPGYFASDNVEWITNIPLHIDSAGAKIVGHYFYITTERDLTIYDISEPDAPERVGYLPLIPPGDFYFPEEDVDTNGKTLIVGNQGTLFVIDVEDKTNPVQVGQADGGDGHTVTCVLDCTYAYASEGKITDLRDRENPKVVGDWSKVTNVSSFHDVTEVAPGFVVTSSSPILLLDARKDPAHPKILARGAPDEFIHDNIWPRKMNDRFLLVGGESGGPQCSENSASFMTWDTSGWERSHTFRMIDHYRLSNGLPTDGKSPANLFCAHWFSLRPGWRNGGVIAMAWYEGGTRFLKVNSAGKISEIGYFLPAGGSTSAAYWLDDEYVYAVDYNRGLDLLRFTGKV